MRKATRSIFFLAVVVALLSVAVYAELGHEHTFAPKPLTSIETATVRSLQIRCSACRTRRFARDADGWHMLEPYILPADADAIARLLAIAHAPVQERHPMSDYDAAKLSLDPAQITLEIDNTSIAIGGEDPIDYDRYVRIGDELLRVPDRFSARLLEAPESELDRHPVPAHANVAAVGLHGEAASSDLAAAWQNAVAASVRAATTAATANDIPVRIDLANGSHLAFRISHVDAAYVGRRENPALDYLFNEAQARLLLGTRD